LEIPFAIEPLTAEANDFETLAGVIQFTPGLNVTELRDSYNHPNYLFQPATINLKKHRYLYNLLRK
jgi:hypothetical protein